VPFFNPGTVIVVSGGFKTLVAVIPPGDEVTLYNVTGVPPSDAGGVKLTVACVSPLTAVTAVGASGTSAIGAITLEGSERELVPIAFVAVIENVYGTPNLNPVTVNGLAFPVITAPSGSDITVYPVIALPPLNAGALKVTLAESTPAVTFVIVGASGTAEGVTLAEGMDAGPVPIPFVAVTLKEYAFPFVSPDTVIGLDTPVPVMFSGLEVTVYNVMGEPFAKAAVKLTAACMLPLTAVTSLGALGRASVGTMALETADEAPAPIALVAVTVNV
jgi:hypothetical protein